ncbi:MAG: nucleotidyltransferase domain-containing protein [Nanoarchaeota archaeon]
MRTDVLSFVLSSENRKSIVRTLFEYPKRQWSCSALEDLTKKPHATVFRTLNGLLNFGILKSIKVNKKDVLYELVDSPLSKQLKKIIDIGKITAKKIVDKFVNKIKSKKIYSILLYGSTIKGNLRPESDIDLLIILNRHDKIAEEKIFNIAAELSSKSNKTISAVIMDIKEINKEKNGQFIKSVKANMEPIYGKKPF